MTSHLDPTIRSTIDDVRRYTHAVGASRMVATLPTLDGEAIIDYRPGDWLKIKLVGEIDPLFVLPPDWRCP